ncbi:hypothetical protein [Paenibacillus sp.]|uniref:hypothetical protein n=1 Tax=Paenibacillus sp. TaxID=58172 RepID=UPI002811AEBF|nr:hypothetical protein [Paenibacillus sp.]
MTKTDILTVNPQELARAWNETLPVLLNASDKATVVADERDANVLRIHIDTAGRSMYSFDFKCTYVDSREVKVEIVDAERGHDQADETREIIQSLIEDYVRHIHECAQRLKGLTNA